MTEPVTKPTASDDVLPSFGYRAYFLLIMVLLSASVQGERYMLMVMVEPIRREFGLNDTQIGLVKDMAIALVYILAVIPMARLADRKSKRVVVAAAALVWSAAVLLCGAAKNFWFLLLGRAGIGLGEGGFTSPSQAWIADLFPVKQRATALAIFLLGASLGTYLGPALGGQLTQDYGWRTALMLASIPGFILVPIVWFTLRDTRTGLADGVVVDTSIKESFGDTMRSLWAIKTLPLLIGAAAINSLLTLGIISWAPAFMERMHGMPAAQVGRELGGAMFIGSVIGHTVGGPLADWLGRRDLRWYIWMLMLAGAIASISAYFILTGPANRVLPMFGLNMLIGGLSAAPLLAVVAGIVPAKSRATAVAVLMVMIQVIGLGAGPLFVGWLSDLLRPVYGEASLGMAMRWVLITAIPSTLLAWFASRTVRADLAAAGGWDHASAKSMVAH